MPRSQTQNIKASDWSDYGKEYKVAQVMLKQLADSPLQGTG
ncbi:hypothetical protein BTN49_0058 [Candidatus Enterovibrio escicola]|uniref:Uncharacterized protein n=1 Tax=Candidatus Enterovibrio escicola TaxID=1927127 RepID=A0A2A5T823_9GAMM|nr:hypothetical protein BTN49_0058 [Candidatus Enterovibrio escacola]